MNPEELVEYCFDNGVELFIENGNLKARGDENQICELVPTLKGRRVDLTQYLEYLNRRPSEPYQEESLSRYFMEEGWSYEVAIKLAGDMIKRDSSLPRHEQVKYLKFVSKC